MTNKHLKLAIGLGAALSFTACTAGQTGPPTQTTVDPTVGGNSQLSLAVGTANVAGAVGVSLNVVALYRQKNGSSAVLVDTPKLTGPFTLPVAAATPANLSGQYDADASADLGPGAAEIAAKFIEGSPQPTQVGTQSSVTSTFGVYGGVFGTGFGPYNYGTSGVPAEADAGNPNGPTHQPYYQPFYAGHNVATGDIVPTSNAFLPTAGPPAFDPAGNGAGATGPNFPFNGLTLGLNVFQGVAPVAGAYSLSVAIPTIGSTLSPTPAAATLANAGTVLPVQTAGGAAPAITFNGDGSATVTNVALAAPAVGAYVQVIDYGPIDTTAAAPATGCNGARVSRPRFYTHWVTATGPVIFANANAPFGQTIAICTAAQNAAAGTGDTYTGDRVQTIVIGFDYNEYSLTDNGPTGAAYPQAPALPAQADTSISLSTYATSL